jgi:hypothetical protein
LQPKEGTAEELYFNTLGVGNNDYLDRRRTAFGLRGQNDII